MKIVEKNSNIENRENKQILSKISKEKYREKILNDFRRSKAAKLILEMIDKEISKAADVRNIPSDANNLTETAKLLIINQRALSVLEILKEN